MKTVKTEVRSLLADEQAALEHRRGLLEAALGARNEATGVLTRLGEAVDGLVDAGYARGAMAEMLGISPQLLRLARAEVEAQKEAEEPQPQPWESHS